MSPLPSARRKLLVSLTFFCRAKPFPLVHPPPKLSATEGHEPYIHERVLFLNRPLMYSYYTCMAAIFPMSSAALNYDSIQTTVCPFPPPPSKDHKCILEKHTKNLSNMKYRINHKRVLKLQEHVHNLEKKRDGNLLRVYFEHLFKQDITSAISKGAVFLRSVRLTRKGASTRATRTRRWINHD